MSSVLASQGLYADNLNHTVQCCPTVSSACVTFDVHQWLFLAGSYFKEIWQLRRRSQDPSASSLVRFHSSIQSATAVAESKMRLNIIDTQSLWIQSFESYDLYACTHDSGQTYRDRTVVCGQEGSSCHVVTPCYGPCKLASRLLSAACHCIMA